MREGANHWLCVLLTAVVCPLLFSACSNDLKKIREISNREVNSPADTTRGVDAIYSDSAKVKARALAPLMLEYAPSKDIKEEYKLMPKGVTIIFFDEHQKETGRVVADTAYFYPLRKLFNLRKHVVITSIKGDVFTSEELNWDNGTDKITTNKPFEIKRANGDIGHGTSLVTNGRFDHYDVTNQTGIFTINRDLGQ